MVASGLNSLVHEFHSPHASQFDSIHSSQFDSIQFDSIQLTARNKLCHTREARCDPRCRPHHGALATIK